MNKKFLFLAVSGALLCASGLIFSLSFVQNRDHMARTESSSNESRVCNFQACLGVDNPEASGSVAVGASSSGVSRPIFGSKTKSVSCQKFYEGAVALKLRHPQSGVDPYSPRPACAKPIAGQGK